MNNTEQMNALLGKKNPSGGTGEDWEARCHALEHELQTARVEQGRVQKLNARIKELESELAKLRAGGGAAKTVTLTPEEQGEIPDEYVGAAAKLADRAANNAVAGVNAELEQLRRERAAEKAEAQERIAAEFVRRIDRRYPGFLASIGEGGDKHDAWASFLVNNAASVQEAFGKCDYDSLVYHIDRFYREVLEVRPPNGEKGNASAPDPVPHGGGKPKVAAGGEKIYTAEEYSALQEKCMKLQREGKDEEFQQLRAELDKALSEDRIDYGE